MNQSENLVKESLSAEGNYLVLTNLDKSGLSKDNLIMLGDWCFDLKTKNWEHLRMKSLPYHWSNREKFKKDYAYLSKLNEQMLCYLAKSLNEYHRLKYSERFWRIVIGPWLQNYISVIFDRWETVENYLNKFGTDFDTSITDEKNKPPLDFFDFRGYLDNDFWNHLLISEILRYRLPSKRFKKLTISDQEKVNEFKGNDRISNSKLKRFIITTIISLESAFKLILKKLNIQKRYVFFETGIHKNLFIKILIGLRTLPFFYFSFREKVNAVQAERENNIFGYEFASSNEFEDFLLKRLQIDIPIAYIEEFKRLLFLTEREFQAKKIVSAYGFWYNEYFKIWAAKEAEKNARIIHLEHGGSLQLSMNTMRHYEKISDVSVCWGIEMDPKHKRLPPNKLNIKKRKRVFDSRQREITLYDYESVRFSYRAVGAPIGPLVLDEHLQKKEFLNLLPSYILDKIKVKPKSLGSWFPEESYKRSFGKKIISERINTNEVIKNSSLIISSYPQTTFSEAMFSGTPSMLLYIEELWEIDDIYSELIMSLKESKILHTSATSAANHLIAISNNFDDWWMSSDVAESRKYFARICNTISKNPSKDWIDFLQKCN